ncbi:hypothetical protein Bhyg_13112, partial [Pseudolycoriella hygida]
KHSNEYCGQYGFRCVDTESFQICSFPDLEGVTEAPETIHKCLHQSVCDENNIAFCTPLEQTENFVTAKEKGKCHKKGGRKRSEKISPKNHLLMRKNRLMELQKILEKSEDNHFDFNVQDESEIETTTLVDYDDNQSLEFHSFDCESFGYFPDIYNASMFWHCDHKNQGQGFVVRHMLCSPGRVFNPRHKECVMIDTTRNIRNNLKNS